jgi:hypothetical protein
VSSKPQNITLIFLCHMSCFPLDLYFPTKPYYYQSRERNQDVAILFRRHSHHHGVPLATPPFATVMAAVVVAGWTGRRDLRHRLAMHRYERERKREEEDMNPVH